MFQTKRHSWEMSNFVPREEPQVPLLMLAVQQQNAGTSGDDDDDDEDDDLGRMCNGLLDDEDQQQLSPLTVIDKSALADADTSIVGMSHDIDDVVDSVINHDDLPPLADLSDLTILPPPSHPPPSLPTLTAATAKVGLMPKASMSSSVPGLTYVNSEPAVLVRLKRLNFHSYRSSDGQRCVRTSASTDCVGSVNVSKSDRKLTESSSSTVDATCNANANHTFVKREPTLGTSTKPDRSPTVVSKLVSAKHGCGREISPMKKSASKSAGCAGGDDQPTPVVVLTALPTDTVTGSGHHHTQQSAHASKPSKLSSVKRMSDVASDLTGVKRKKRSDVAPSHVDSNRRYVTIRC